MADVAQVAGERMVCPATDQAVGRHRASLASEIGAHLPDLARKLAKMPKGTTYRVVLSRPVGGGLTPRADGLYDAFAKGPDGKIQAVARLSKVGPGFLTSATMLAGHAMLAQISSQLSMLQADVDLLLRLQVAGELGKVKAGVMTLRTIHHYDDRHRDQVLLSTVANLKLAIGTATQQAVELIRAVPEPPRTNVARSVWDTSGDTVKALDRAAEAVRVVLIGLRALGEAEVLLNNNSAAANIMRDWLRETAAQLDLGRCERLARMMPANNEQERHEVFWMKAADALADSQRYLDGLIEDDTPLRLAFECSGEDLLGKLSTGPANRRSRSRASSAE